MHVQDRWDTLKQERQLLWSGRWDTTLALLQF